MTLKLNAPPFASKEAEDVLDKAIIAFDEAKPRRYRSVNYNNNKDKQPVKLKFKRQSRKAESIKVAFYKLDSYEPAVVQAMYESAVVAGEKKREKELKDRRGKAERLKEAIEMGEVKTGQSSGRLWGGKSGWVIVEAEHEESEKMQEILTYQSHLASKNQETSMKIREKRKQEEVLVVDEDCGSKKEKAKRLHLPNNQENCREHLLRYFYHISPFDQYEDPFSWKLDPNFNVSFATATWSASVFGPNLDSTWASVVDASVGVGLRTPTNASFDNTWAPAVDASVGIWLSAPTRASISVRAYLDLP
eukprot:g80262.t1